MKIAAKLGSTRVCNYYGYVWVRLDHSAFPGEPWVKKHHLVYWKKTGKRVPHGYVLHHKNEVKTDNRFRNLELLTRAKHAALHGAGRKFSSAAKIKMSKSAKERSACPEYRKMLSERAKKQHRDGNFGASTWTDDSKRRIREKAVGRPAHPNVILAAKAVPRWKRVMAGKRSQEEQRLKLLGLSP